jgi:hypothetical protein
VVGGSPRRRLERVVVEPADTAEPWKKTPPESVERAVVGWPQEGEEPERREPAEAWKKTPRECVVERVVGESPQEEEPERMEPAEKASTARRAPARRGEAAIRCRRRRRCEVVSRCFRWERDGGAYSSLTRGRRRTPTPNWLVWRTTWRANGIGVGGVKSSMLDDGLMVVLVLVVGCCRRRSQAQERKS